jgi:hypothetical protein
MLNVVVSWQNTAGISAPALAAFVGIERAVRR